MTTNLTVASPETERENDKRCHNSGQVKQTEHGEECGAWRRKPLGHAVGDCQQGHTETRYIKLLII